MQLWLGLIQGGGALSALAFTVAQLARSWRKSGLAEPFGRLRHFCTESRSSRIVSPERRYLCLSVDVVGYGCTSDLRQAEIQCDLLELLDVAADRVGLDRRRWIRQAKGDEELALIADDQPSSRVVGAFCLALATFLSRFNAERPFANRMRLRLALDEGPVDQSANGYAGRAVVGVSRLVNAKPLRAVLAAADEVDLAVILSDGVYRDWVRSGRSTVAGERFRRVDIDERGYVDSAWLWLPCRSPIDLDRWYPSSSPEFRGA